MPRRKRVNDEADGETPPKRTCASTVASAPNDGNVNGDTPSAKMNGVPKIPAKGKPASRKRKKSPSPVKKGIIVISDSESLSDPPSTISSPVAPSSPPETPKPSPAKRKRPPPRTTPKKPTQSKKESIKANEEALDLLVRDESDEDDSTDEAPSSKQITAAPRSETGGEEVSTDEDDDIWEDVDLSHRKQVSLNDIHDQDEQPQDLEVTLERTKQSMRIKFVSRLPKADVGIKHPVPRKGKSERILICYMFNVYYSTVHYGTHGYKILNYEYEP
jgi:hypothetical protein